MRTRNVKNRCLTVMEPSEQEKLSAEDWEVEITDLPAGKAASRDFWSRLTARAGSGTRGQRVLQVSVTLCLLVLCLAILLQGMSGLPETLFQRIFGGSSTSVAPTALDSNLFYIDGEPAWGQLRVDGKAV